MSLPVTFEENVKNKLKQLVCRVFGHKYTQAQRLTFWSRRLHCTRCHKSFAMNDDMRTLVDWDRDFERLYKARGVKIRYLPTEKSFLAQRRM